MNNLSAVESIFFAALDKGSPEERAAYLDQACGPDRELRACVERLLNAEPRVGSFLQAPAPAVPATVEEPPLTEKPGSVIGPYKLMEQIGEGGMGLVFVAEQQQPVRRKVALKILKPGMDSRNVLARFEAERQALALMDHPNIAKVFDAGATADGRPYFVMELVKGTPITEFCDLRKLSPRERLELFVPVCQALQHAHQKGVIHRDVKPSNVLVALHDEAPVPKVIDFGVAKAVGQQLTEKTVYTGFGALIGTPAYMAPEQAMFNQLDIDTRADVYALGVLLYELLAGSPPVEPERLKRAALDEVLRIVRDEEPPRPSQRLSTSQTRATIAATRQSDPGKLARMMRGELDWIVMKALEKDRGRRYETASAFAADVRRFLAEEPIEARPPSPWYRLRKFTRRNRVAVFLTAFVAATVLAVLTNTLLGLRHVRQERDRAVQAEAVASERLEEVTREKERATEAEEGAQAVLEFTLLKLVAAARPKGLEGGLGRDVTVRAALDAAEPDLERQFTGRPKFEAIFRNALGENLIYLGEPARAIRHLERAVKLRREEFGPDHPGTLQSVHNLAAAYRIAGRTDEALALLEDLVPRARAALGEDHPHYFLGLNNLAEALIMAGRYDRARTLLEEALGIMRRVSGDDDPHTLHVQSNLGDTLQFLGQAARAVELLEDAMRRATKVFPPDHTELLGITNYLALAYHAAGRREAALALLEKGLAQAKTSLGPDHMSTLTLMGNLAEIAAQQKQYDKAIRLFQELLEAARRGPEAGGLNVALAQVRLGECYYQQRKYAEAEPVLRQGYESLKPLGANLPPVGKDALIQALDRLDQLCQLQGKPEEAAKWRAKLKEWQP